jgi:hypothetical protein
VGNAFLARPGDLELAADSDRSAVFAPRASSQVPLEIIPAEAVLPAFAEEFTVRHVVSGRFILASPGGLRLGARGDVFRAEGDGPLVAIRSGTSYWTDDGGVLSLGTVARPLFRFDRGSIRMGDILAITAKQGKLLLRAHVENARQQLFELLPAAGDLLPPQPGALGLVGQFAIRHIASGRFLMVSSDTGHGVDFTLCFDYRMEIFTADSQGEWAFVRSGNGKHWYVSNSSGRSRIGIHNGGNAQNDYCRYKFVEGAIIVQQMGRRLTVSHGEAWVDASNADRPESQLFEVIPMKPVVQSPLRSVRAHLISRMVSDFRVRNLGSGRYMAVTEQKCDSLICTLEFKENGDVFHAESDAEWTRVVWKGDLVWFHLKANPPSQLGLNDWSDRTSLFCQFKFVDGYIYDRQRPGRVLTVGSDGRAWGLDKKDFSLDQQFQLIAGEGELDLTNVNSPVPMAILFDGRLLDKFQ